MEDFRSALSLSSLQRCVEGKVCTSDNIRERGRSLHHAGTDGWSSSVHRISHIQESSTTTRAWYLRGTVVQARQTFRCSAYVCLSDPTATGPTIPLTQCSCTKKGIKICEHIVAFFYYLHDANVSFWATCAKTLREFQLYDFDFAFFVCFHNRKLKIVKLKSR